MSKNGYDFYKRINLVGPLIPYGKVATYGQIALLCGKPDNARQVGYALRSGRTAEDFPAHRLLNNRGYLSGRNSFATPELQRELLLREGVPVSEDYLVNLKQFGWHHTLAEAEELYLRFTQLGI